MSDLPPKRAQLAFRAPLDPRRAVPEGRRVVSGREMPELVFVPTQCRRCGARTEQDAETRCVQSSDETGEYDCSVGTEFRDGVAVVPTPESLAALDAWIDAKVKEDGWYE